MNFSIYVPRNNLHSELVVLSVAYAYLVLEVDANGKFQN